MPTALDPPRPNARAPSGAPALVERLRDRLARRDPVLAVLRRATRVTLRTRHTPTPARRRGPS